VPQWRALLVDLPGMGQARAAHEGVASMSDILDRLVALVDDLAADGLAVAGNSNGGALALGLAQRRPSLVRGLSVRVPMLEPSDEQRRRQGQADWELAFDALPEEFRAEHARVESTLWDPARDRADDAFLATIRNDPERYGLREAMAPNRFDGPALIVLGRQDRQVGWRRAVEQFVDLPRATVAVLDRCGHVLPVGEPQTLLWQALAVDWLHRVEEDWTRRG